MADELPVARVAVDIPLAHLDRPFDYLVTAAQDASAVPGCRVRVRFAGQLVDGYLIDRVPSSAHGGRLSPLASVVSAERVLTPAVLDLARAVADRYAGTLADVLRLAVPPRHAAVEKETADPVTAAPTTAGARPTQVPDPGPWTVYRRGPALLRALAEGRQPRAAWSALPGPSVGGDRPHWVGAVVTAVAATSAGGRGSLVVVPDHRDVDQVSAALRERDLEHVVLGANLGPQERYRRWLRVLRGQVDVVLGTRAAVYAPVHRLGLVVVWDDGDDLHAEPRAPYPHVREVAALRAHRSGCGLLLGGHTRSTEVAAMVERGFVESVVPDRTEVRRVAPRVRASSDALSDRDPLAAAARLPSAAWRVARDALPDGPVLVQVPRRGYVPHLVCDRCRSRVRCVRCQGPVGVPSAAGQPVCQWCATPAAAFQCPECGHDQLRAAVVGARRTAEELGRAFPGVPVLTSGGRDVRAQVGDASALVVATPGAEPWAPGGYAAALLLDSWALLGRADLRADEEALRRWTAAAALVRSSGAGGRVVLVADAALRVVQALVRWDPVGFATHELAERQVLGLPPARRFAVVTGPADVLRDFRDVTELPGGTDTYGPVPRPSSTGEPVSAWVLAASPAAGAELAVSLRHALGQLTVRKKRVPRVQVDPADLVV
jgi:primosomal protein N' (replication factor Y)